jgi:septal ring factor EnvC (AmiA/AmiB activator)
MSENEQNEENQNNPQSQYKEMVKSWLETDEKISKLMTTLKELKDEKKQYENYIIDYMEENHNVEVSVPEGKIKKAMLKSKGGFNEKVIITGLAEITKDETKAKDITKVISQKRENKEKIYLKKCKRGI